MKRLKVVQIGALHDHAKHIIKSLKRLDDVFELMGYMVPEGECVDKPELYEDVKLLTEEEAFNIPDLDAVIIETGELNLTRYALMAAEKGIAVHMDKPGGTVLSDFEKLIETVKKKNIVFHTGYMYRYNPSVIKLMKDIRDGKLGEIYSVEGQMNCMHLPEKREWLNNFKGGEMFFLGCHMIDLIYRILGEPQEIIPLNCSTGMDGVNSEDYGMVVFKYPNGISFAQATACEPCGFMRRQLVVCGSKGRVQLSPFETMIDRDNLYTEVCEVFDNIYDWDNAGVKYRTENINRYDDMMRSFAEYVRGERKNPYTYDYELNLYKLILKSCNA